MVEDLGPYILNLLPDSENNCCWEDEDGLSIHALDDELTESSWGLPYQP